ncbi:MAG TPA: cell division protein ZipA C-terminal FtsZ-binding domain-containing protein [Ramlibacter sp.]|nr:cell division protein ZipA C-terminal FtsZ-binding domain-containing protein [Ramlibacter sp.]
MWLIVVAVLAVVGGGIYWKKTSQGRQARKLPALAPEGMFLATSSESRQRANQLLPSRGSEDRRDLLRAPDASGPPEEHLDGFRPNSATDWIVDLSFPEGISFPKNKILEVLDRTWLKVIGAPMLYGKPEGGTWTYVFAKDSPAAYSQIALGWRLNQDFDRDWKPPRQADFEAYLKELTDRCATFGETRLLPSLAPAEAVEKAVHLRDLKNRLSQDAIIVLQAPNNQSYAGLDIWDAMLSLGLEWGDMDIFHWPNDSGEGGDFWFDVWTTTPPGYFYPEEIAAGNVKVVNLVFGFSIPRTLQPDSVFESMMRAADYARHRLGGRLLADDGSEFKSADALRQVRYAARELTAAGFPPGANRTLYLF